MDNASKFDSKLFYLDLIWSYFNRDSTRGFLEGYYTQGVPILIEEANFFDIFLSFSPTKIIPR